MSVDIALKAVESLMLKRVVDLYIEIGEPVSSKALKRKYRLSESTANIRNILHSLEEKGYLYKPHVSAGRMPTDAGYRFYVDNLGDYDDLGRDVLVKIKDQIGRDLGDLRDLMLKTSRLLGELTSYMGIMMGVYHDYGRITRLEIVQGEGSKGLVLVFLSSGMRRSISMDFKKRYPNHTLYRANQIINERISGSPVDEALDRLNELINESAGTEREITQSISVRARNLFDWPYDLKYYLDDNYFSSGIAELRDPLVLRRLVTIMGKRNLMLDLMRERMGEGFLVTIGKENTISELRDFSIVTQNFGEKKCLGILGVLGPTRMSYKRVLPLLKQMVLELNRF